MRKEKKGWTERRPTQRHGVIKGTQEETGEREREKSNSVNKISVSV